MGRKYRPYLRPIECGPPTWDEDAQAPSKERSSTGSEEAAVFSTFSNTSRREMLAATAAGGVAFAVASGLAEAALAGGVAGAPAIRPFQVHVPDDDLIDLKRRLKATRWPERETVNDTTQGVRLATIQALARYWTDEHDWRRCEASLNALPQFVTEVDGLDIHFIHV